MRIKSLRLAGFKSFVEPAELHIATGLTGIVGPNGCGKSNLLEAIRWVMGELSAKSLRGGGMEDVIFAGTTLRPPRDFAEVTIRAERGVNDIAPGIAGNDEDPELEITRRIERGAGSAYRSNGRDLRAKDVALIFADAATGAHSPALVGQGRIGAIIAAKPNERRQMLEEAAGISGLHVRRKDAEQKLRAAEQNLDKLSHILADMEARAGLLRRQTKQAERYRKLSAEITQGEARLIFVRWREAKAAADAADAEARAADEAVKRAAMVQQQLAGNQQAAAKKLADDRAAAMIARDSANNFSGKLIQLSGERDHACRRQADLQSQSEHMAQDAGREDRLTLDAAGALEQLQEKSAQIAGDIKLAEEERPLLIRAAENAERGLRESEVALAKAMAEQARADAELRVAKAALAGAQARRERAASEHQRVASERDSLGDEAEMIAAKNTADAKVLMQQNAIAALAKLIADAETQRHGLSLRRDQSEIDIAAANANLAALRAENDALERARPKTQGNKAVDRIAVQPGYERALAAALGDDVTAAIGGAQGRRWTAVSADANGALAGDPPRLLQFVDAPPELTNRLAHIFVTLNDDGRPLNPGERLVSLDGKLRRWDGFCADGEGAATAEHLIRANRLTQLTGLIAAAQQEVLEKAARGQSLGEEIAEAQQAASLLHADHQAAENALRHALRDADKCEDALARMRSAAAALAQRSAAVHSELIAAAAEMDAAQGACALLPDGAQHDGLVTALSAQSDTSRQQMMQSQASLSALHQRIAQLRERRAVAQADIRSWSERAGEAQQRIADINRRRGEIAAELAEIEGHPERLAQQIAEAEQAKHMVNEKLAVLQAAERASEAALQSVDAEISNAAEALSTAREARAGALARAENQENRRIEMAGISGERFECPPPLLPQKLDFDPSQLSEASAESARLDRLQAERERIGPVNLIAADELIELEAEREHAATQSAELTEAINRLRGSIGALNREGRQRLLAAFEAVDRHFRRLFTTLFGGGQAHLALIDSDDPLEAGLEIMAQPPGKKLASLTLLSGGEQALTATALIFGLFLTNPAPICVLDEVDAPLDDANIERFCDLLDLMQKETDTSYLIVTHNAVTMSRMHRLFGVTMVEQGVSRLVSVDLGGAEALLAAE